MEWIYEHRDGYLFAKGLGDFDFDHLVNFIKASHEKLNQLKMRKFFINLLDIKGHADTVQQYNIGRTLENLGASARVAVLLKKENYDRFVSNVAQNRGTPLETFSDEKEAIVWLLSR